MRLLAQKGQELLRVETNWRGAVIASSDVSFLEGIDAYGKIASLDSMSDEDVVKGLRSNGWEILQVREFQPTTRANDGFN